MVPTFPVAAAGVLIRVSYLAFAGAAPSLTGLNPIAQPNRAAFQHFAACKRNGSQRGCRAGFVLAGIKDAWRAFRAIDGRKDCEADLVDWKPATAVACLLALAKHHELPLREAQAGHMIELLGCPIPHHVQMFFDQVNTAYVVDEVKGDVSDALIDEVYRSSMTGLRGHPELSHMEERLRTAMPLARFTKALGLLTEAATVGSISHSIAIDICRLGPAESNSSPECDVTEIFSILVHDGYLRQEGDVLCFESTLLRDWWKRRFGHGYRSVANTGGTT